MRARPLVLATAGLALGTLLAGCAGSSADHSAGSHQMSDGSTMSGATMPATTPGEAASQGAGAVGAGNAGDIAFAQLMIPHHEQAIEMAALALAPQAKASREVTALADQITQAQDPEIQVMTQWLAAWGAPTQMPGVTGDPADADHGGHDMGGMDMSGMMSAEDMTALGASSGTEFDRMWLEMMIAHHQGAIDMARQVQSTTANGEVQTLAATIIEGQAAEIATMRKLLGS